MEKCLLDGHVPSNLPFRCLDIFLWYLSWNTCNISNISTNDDEEEEEERDEDDREDNGGYPCIIRGFSLWLFLFLRFSRLWTRTAMVFSVSKNLSLVSMWLQMVAGILHVHHDNNRNHEDDFLMNTIEYCYSERISCAEHSSRWWWHIHNIHICHVLAHFAFPMMIYINAQISFFPPTPPALPSLIRARAAFH